MNHTTYGRSSSSLRRFELQHIASAYDGQTTGEVQTASNEDPMEMHVEDADVDVDLFQGNGKRKMGKFCLVKNGRNPAI
jgi:hypothetical protein